jgi:fucose permease
MIRQNKPVVPVFLAFLAMGFGDAVGPFVGLAKEHFQLSNVLAQCIPLVGFLMFGLLSTPMGVLQDKRGKKFTLVLGLVIMLAGILIPSLLALSTFPVFLITILLLGAGATTLQVAGNPMMRDVSPDGKFARNLSLGQFVKAIGSLSGPLIPVLAARLFGASWEVIFPVYSVALVLALLAAFWLPRSEPSRSAPATLGSSIALLRIRFVAIMVLGIFFYVGAEVCLSSSIPLYLKDRFGVDISGMGLIGTGVFFLSLTIGRFTGGLILNWLSPRTFFIVTSILSLVGLAGVFVAERSVVLLSFVIIGLGFANIFPLIFSIVVDAMPEHTNALSGLMVAAIAGGAIVPPVMGLVADRLHSIQAAFLVPLAAVLYIAGTAIARPQPARKMDLTPIQGGSYR